MSFLTELEDVLGKIICVPLFQEQAMRIAVIAAGFTPAEVDRLRRAMATFRKSGIIHEFGMRLIEGMVARGYTQNFAERCFRQIEGLGNMAFPKAMRPALPCSFTCRHGSMLLSCRFLCGAD